MFLDQAEFRAQRRQNIHIADWEAFLDKFLADTELPVLEGSGKISHAGALDWASEQYDAYSQRRLEEEGAQAEKKYVQDLRNAAKLLENERTEQESGESANKHKRKGK